MAARAERPDRLTIAGMAVVAAAAVIASGDALADLADATGWGGRVKWLLPATVDFLAAVALRVWMDPTAPDAARRFARLFAWSAIATSIAGNAASHLIATGDLTVSWPLIVAVGAVPAAAIGAVAHLHALRTAPVPGRVRKARSAAVSAPQSVAPSATDSVDTPLPSAADVPRKPTNRGRGRVTSSAECADRAVAAYRPGVTVDRDWVMEVTGCKSSTAYKILPDVRERVRGQAGSVITLTRTDRTEATG
jgi:Protein of unknown function (DUF2637)